MGAREVEGAGQLLERALGALVVEAMSAPEADRLVASVVRWERQLAALRMALVRRVAQTGAHEAVGGRDPVSYLSRHAGISTNRARAELDLAERLEKLPEVERAVRNGKVSSAQAAVIAPAVAVSPDAAASLVNAAGKESLQVLRQRAARAERAGRKEEDQEEKEWRVHQRRYCRTSAPRSGGVRLVALLPALTGARVLAALQKKTDELLKESDEPAERLAADALAGLVAGEGVTTEVSVRVDAGALVRGSVEGDEACEIPGVGPVSVRVARAVLGEALFTLLVTRADDISTVTSTSRVVPRKVRKALEERDRCCVVPGCGATFHLQIDHWRVDFAAHGITALDNLCRLCSVHHRQKTAGIIRLGGGPGRWWVRPGARADGAGAARPEHRSRTGP